MSAVKTIFITILITAITIKNLMAFNYQPNTVKTKFFKDVAISEVNKLNNVKGMEFTILISTKRKLTPNELVTGASPTTFPEEFTIDKPIWEITHRLPVGEDECLQIDASNCNAELNKDYSGSCFKPCLIYGPQFLTFDEKNNKIYFLVDTTRNGSAGAQNFIFSGDLKTQKIEYLGTKFGSIDGSMSPNSKYVIFNGMNFIDIYDPISKRTISIVAPWGKDSQKRSIIPGIFGIKWLSDTTFSYREDTRHSKFQSSSDTMKENIYDITQQKIIKSRQMNLSEFDHTQTEY